MTMNMAYISEIMSTDSMCQEKKLVENLTALMTALINRYNNSKTI